MVSGYYRSVVDSDRLIMGLASVFGGLAVLLTVVGIVYEPFVITVALLFGAVAYFMWYQASGRLSQRIYKRVEEQARANNGQNEHERGGFGAGPREEWNPRSEWARQNGFTTEQHQQQTQQTQQTRRGQQGQSRSRSPRPDRSTVTATEAYDILGLDPDADEAAIKRAYREKVKDAHPDTDTGSKEAFKRVNAAYERLTGG